MLFLSCYTQCFFIISVVRKKIKVKLALAIPTGAPTILVNEIIDTPLVAARKTIEILKVVACLLNFWLHDFLWLISLINYFQFYLFCLNETWFVQISLFCQLLWENYFYSIFKYHRIILSFFLKNIWRKQICIISQFFTC